MQKIFLLGLMLVNFTVCAANVCKILPQQTVSVQHAGDILFPPLSAKKVKEKTFIVESYVDGGVETGGRRLYQLRGPDGGSHLATGDSLQTTSGQKTLDALLGKNCLPGDKDAFEALLKAYIRHEATVLVEAAIKLNSLPEDKVLCRPSNMKSVSVSDTLFMQMRSGNQPGPLPYTSMDPNSASGQQLYMPPPAPQPPPVSAYPQGKTPDTPRPAIPVPGLTRPLPPQAVNPYRNSYGMGFGGTYRPAQVLQINRFELLGQVLARKDAPTEFQNTAGRSDRFAWRQAEVGMYLIRDHLGTIHAVKPSELSERSLTELKSANFSCNTNTPEKYNMREVAPNPALREPPTTTAH
jgi:hypothetical protein